MEKTSLRKINFEQEFPLRKKIRYSDFDIEPPSDERRKREKQKMVQKNSSNGKNISILKNPSTQEEKSLKLSELRTVLERCKKLPIGYIRQTSEGKAMSLHEFSFFYISKIHGLDKFTFKDRNKNIYRSLKSVSEALCNHFGISFTKRKYWQKLHIFIPSQRPYYISLGNFIPYFYRCKRNFVPQSKGGFPIKKIKEMDLDELFKNKLYHRFVNDPSSVSYIFEWIDILSKHESTESVILHYSEEFIKGKTNGIVEE